MAENNKDYIRKNVDTIILRTLSESDSYGYDILKEIEAKSNGVYVVKQPTLYNSLKRLEKIGYISSYEGEISQGGKRRYYSLTDLGRKVLEKEVSEWEFSRTLMGKLLSEKEYDLNNPPPYDPNELRPMTKRNVSVYDNPASTNYGGQVIPQKETSPINNTPTFNSTPILSSNAIDNKLEISKPSAVESAPHANISSPSQKNSPIVEAKDYKNTKGYQLLYGDLKPEKNETSPIINNSVNDNREKPNYSQNSILHNSSKDDVIKENSSEYFVKKESSNKPIEGIQLSGSFQRKTGRVVDPLEPKPLTEKDIFTNNVQYRPALDDLFGSSIKNNDIIDKPEPKLRDISPAGQSFNTLKAKFKTEGFKLKPYNSSNSKGYYLSNFIYNNQINRDCVTIIYLFIVLQIFAVYNFANHLLNIELNAYITIASGLILIPISFWIIYAVNPERRIRAKFNFKLSILTSMMIFLNILVVIMLTGFFLFKADIRDIDSMLLPVIIPSVLIINIPLCSIVYSLLYKSKKYHLK